MTDSEQPSAEKVILKELLECAELNQDTIEEHTREVIERAYRVLNSSPQRP